MAGVNAKVFITKLSGTQSLPVPPGSGGAPPAGTFRLEDLGPATAGQTVFTLPSTPTNPSALLLFVEGVQYSAVNGFFTVVGTTLTWLDAAPPGALPAGARVEAYYQ